MDINFVVTYSADQVPTIVVTSSSTLVNNTNSTNSVLIESESTIVTTEPEVEVIQAGQVGPRGQSAEDIDMHSKRVDFVSDDVIYKGEAVPGTLPGWPRWRLHKLVISVDGDVTETWANGNALFDKVWDDRLNYEYI